MAKTVVPLEAPDLIRELEKTLGIRLSKVAKERLLADPELAALASACLMRVSKRLSYTLAIKNAEVALGALEWDKARTHLVAAWKFLGKRGVAPITVEAKGKLPEDFSELALKLVLQSALADLNGVLMSDDPDIKAADAALATLKKLGTVKNIGELEAAVAQLGDNLGSVTDLLDEANELLDKEPPDLVGAEGKLKAAVALLPKYPAISPVKERLAEAQKFAVFVRCIADAKAALALDPRDFDIAHAKLKESQALYPDHEDVASLANLIKEATKRQGFENVVATTRAMLLAEKTDAGALLKLFVKAAELYPLDPLVTKLREDINSKYPKLAIDLATDMAEALSNLNLETAKATFGQLKVLAPFYPTLAILEGDLVDAGFVSEFHLALDESNIAAARAAFDKLKAHNAQYPTLAKLEQTLLAAEEAAKQPVGEKFSGDPTD